MRVDHTLRLAQKEMAFLLGLLRQNIESEYRAIVPDSDVYGILQIRSYLPKAIQGVAIHGHQQLYGLFNKCRWFCCQGRKQL